MGRFPSGQREQTVNLPSQTSVVRIHPYPLHAGMAELADAHGSGPCEGDFMQVQLLLSAPETACDAVFVLPLDILKTREVLFFCIFDVLNLRYK